MNQQLLLMYLSKTKSLGLIRASSCIKKNVGCMLVTHDMGVSNVTDRVAVMYRGDLVARLNETSIGTPEHPYAQLDFSRSSLRP